MGRNKVAALAFVGMVALAPFAANAAYTSTTPCASGVGTVGTTFTAVELAINAGQFTRTADQTNLLSKLVAAYSKATSTKGDLLTKVYPDAIAKLEDLSDAAVALAGAAKPKLVSADGITASVLAAQQCLLATVQ